MVGGVGEGWKVENEVGVYMFGGGMEVYWM